MYEAANFFRRLKPKEKLIIQSKEGKTSNPKDCAEIITEHFQGVFYNKNCKPIPEIQPTEMRTPFTEEEIQRVIMSMKNKKSGGCDLMTPELIKYGDKEIRCSFFLCISFDDRPRYHVHKDCWPVSMMTSSNGNISALLLFVRGIHRWPVNSPHKGQWRGALMFSLTCAWINDWVNNRGAGDLRRHRAH